jgi:hypothetical protein
MKTTGSIRVEIESEGEDGHIVSFKNIHGTTVTAAVHKSDVTDIREEVDWSKVKKNTPCVFWDAKYKDWFFLGFYGGYDENTKSYICWQVYDSHKHSCGEPYYDHCMLLKDWLKEHGGQDE